MSTVIVLTLALGLGGCLGDSSDDGNSGDDTGTGPVSPDLTAVAELLMTSMQQAFFASLIADPTTVPGASGVLEIAGDTWTFRDYSPDGSLVMNGTLIVEKGKYPTIPAKGSLALTGLQTGTLIVDIVVSVQGVELVTTGTITLGDQVWDMSALNQQGKG
jgi:hypothetical protein